MTVLVRISGANGSGEENDCLKNGRAVYVCGRCQKEKIEHLPALGHLDENGDQICDRCGVWMEQKRMPMEKVS